MPNKGYFYIFMAAALWASIGPAAKIAFAEGMQPLDIGFWRAAFGTIFFAAHALLSKQYHIKKEDIASVVTFGFFSVALFFASYQTAIQKGGAALACVLMYTAPAWVALLSRIFLQEAMTRIKLVSVFLSILGAGAVAVGADPGGNMQIGPLAVTSGLTAGLTYALYYIFGKKFLNSYTSANIFMYALPVGCVFMLPFSSLAIPSIKAFGAVLYLGIFSTYGAFWCYYQSLRTLEASKAAIVATCEPVLAAIIAFGWWGESFTFWGYIGGLLIISSVLLTVKDKN